jgi:hypothetical protein
VDYFVEVSASEGKVSIHCGTDWFHYANTNDAWVFISKERAREVAKELLAAAGEDTAAGDAVNQSPIT